MKEIPPQAIPARLSTMEVLSLIQSGQIGAAHILQLQQQSGWSNRALAECLSIPAKKVGAWKRTEKAIPEKEQEHLLMLLSLFTQGEEVFENVEDFRSWLESENFHFGGKQPLTYLKFIHGIEYVSARLTGMEYGDNG